MNAVPSDQENVTRRSGGRTALACVFLVLATLAVYWPARHYQFVAYDDNDYVYQNQMVSSGLTWAGVKWALVDRQANNWHPLTWLSHMTDCQIFGLNAGGPHLVNVAFHCANAVLLFLLLQSLFVSRAGLGELKSGLDGVSPHQEKRRLARTLAPPWVSGRNFFVAALFALHPLRVESVAWISERKDVLSAFFGLLALLGYASYVRSNAAPKASLAYRLAAVFFACSLLSKPMLVTLPLIILLLDYWPLQRFPVAPKLSDSAGGNRSTLRSLLIEKWPFFLLAVIFCVITLVAQRPGLPAQNLGLGARMESIGVNYLVYIEKLVWPANLSFLYLRPETIPILQFLLAVLVLVSISALAWVARQRWPALAMGWLWFLIVLLPVSGIVSLGRLAIADRYTYFPSIGFYLMAAWGLADLADKVFPARARKILLVMGAAAVLAVCAVMSRRQLACWQNSETLFEHALKVDPNNYVAGQNLRIYLFEKAHPGVRPPPPQ